MAPDNNYLYNGKELNRDYDINLYEYGARWYDPAIGRFIGVDPIADDFPHLSVYNYASNDPIKNIDLHGLQGVPNYMVEHVKERIENAVQGTVDNISSAVQGAGNYIYDKIVGNDAIGNTVDGAELVTDNQKGEIVETVAKGAKVLGPVLDVAEGAKIINDNMTAETSEQKEAAGQDAAKFLLEIGISVGVPAASIPANVLINTSRDGDVVTSPENIDRAAGAFESSISPARKMIENRIKQREEKNDDEKP
ncbi:MAG: RHS repeat-associated core domain-containing protein [Chitinophagales bacterium]|nr:RHS repeat-associated core domain-containing protein [Chitinophagales bacterium]